MNELTNIVKNEPITNNARNDLATDLLEIFKQLPCSFQMIFFGGCLAIVAYAIHKGYSIRTDSGLQITL